MIFLMRLFFFPFFLLLFEPESGDLITFWLVNVEDLLVVDHDPLPLGSISSGG
jgi:hypothetical protein